MEEHDRDVDAAPAAEAVRAEPPLEPDPPRLTAPKTTAGGLPAVQSSLAHSLRQMHLGRTVKTWLAVNQSNGFDCTSCAWGDPEEHRHKFEFCENGAKAMAAEATEKRAGPELFAAHSLAQLSRQSDQWLEAQGRLTHPLIRRPGSDRYEPVSWDEAFDRVAAHLKALASPDGAVFYTSGRTSNEAAFVYQLFVRQFGTNNLPDCSNMCHESSGVALAESIGWGKSTVTLEELEKADAIFCFGQNPGTNHPRMLTSLQVAARHGAKIVSVNPLDEAGLRGFQHPQEALGLLGVSTPLERLHLPVRINGDVAALKGMLKLLLEWGAQDAAFVEAHTEGFEALAADLRATGWEEIERGSGLTRGEIEKAARVAADAERLVICWAMGLTQHRNGVANVQYLANLALLLGMLGDRGAGLCCVRGHSNVQGDRTMGIWERMPDDWLDRLGAEFGFDPPRRHGLDTVAAIEAMLKGEAKVFIGMGGNFLSAAPDTRATARGLENCALTVHVATKLNRSHLVTGEEAILLPCLGRTEIDRQASGEQFVTVENAFCKVSGSHGHLEPASPELRSEVAVVCGLAEKTLGNRSTVDWRGLCADYDRIRDHIARVVPGFEDFNARVRERGGFALPCPIRERRFRTPSGRARFAVHPIPEHDIGPDQLLMMTLRSHDQFNTTIYGSEDRYRGVHGGRRVVFLHPDDVAARGLHSGQAVDLVSHFAGEEERVAERFFVVPYAIPRGCAATYFPEANVLVPLRSKADRSHTPASKSVVISVRPSHP